MILKRKMKSFHPLRGWKNQVLLIIENETFLIFRILRWLTDEEEQLRAKGLPRIDFLVVEMSSVTDIDTSGIHALEELFRSLQKRDVQLVLANPGQTVIDKLHASKFADLLGEKIFLTVADAVFTCAPKIVYEA